MQSFPRILYLLEQDPELKDLLLIQGSQDNQNSEEAEQFLSDLRLQHKSSLCLSPLLKQPKSNVRVYITPCCDIVHSGHFNAFRQSKAMGDYLIVGLVTDKEMSQGKGPPVITFEERSAVVRACKWVDEVIPGYYSVTPELLDELGCDFVTHGDDLAVDKRTGKDVYSSVRDAGRLRTFKRTEGCSTTDIVGKLLLMNTPTIKNKVKPQSISEYLEQQGNSMIATSRRISKFSNQSAPEANDHIVYIPGTWDMIHYGHTYILEKAKALGDYLIVGVYDDLTVATEKGTHLPVMDLFERALNILAMKYVDEVIIGASRQITQEMLISLKINTVVAGKKAGEENQYPGLDLPRQKGILVEVEIVHEMNTSVIVSRLVANAERYTQRYQKSVKVQEEYLETKEYHQEI